MYDAAYAVVNGYVLNKINFEIMFKILYFRRPSNLIESNSLGNINNLWNTHLSDEKYRDSDSKKYIANVTIGKLENRTRKSGLSK